ncbi:MAG: NFACT RNA binding domain-containing protein [Proteobacteria bacterium]|nr:NFACT RNA binding domain-containing protein [Pseudomonadota bacterium]
MAEEIHHFSLGKCWQLRRGGLCFQAQVSSFESSEWHRSKGFLVVQLNVDTPFSWQSDKPTDVLEQGGAAAIVRKYLPTGTISGFTSISDPNSKQLLVMVMNISKRNQTLDNKDSPSASEYENFRVSVFFDRQKYIELVDSKEASLFRLAKDALYTVKKQTDLVGYTSAKCEFDTLSSSKILPNARMPQNSEVSNQADYLGNEPRSQTQDVDQNALGTTQNDPPRNSEIQNELKILREKIKRRRKTLIKTLNQDSQKTATSDEVALLEVKAKSLANWLHMVKPDMIVLHLLPEQVPSKDWSQQLEIGIDPDISPGENLNRLYKTLAKRKRSLDMGQKQLANIKKHIEICDELLLHLKDDAHSLPMHLYEKLGRIGVSVERTHQVSPLSNSTNNANTPSLRQNAAAKTLKNQIGRLFLSSTGASIIVGRNAGENDRLTKAAKSNDWWFHVKNSSGSHVVVPARSLTKFELDDHTKNEACILAIHFSSQANSRESEVTVTTKNYLRKIKGAPLGQWNIQRSSSYLVRYSAGDVSSLFNREVRLDRSRSKQED